MIDVSKLTNEELVDRVKSTYDVCVEFIRRSGYYKYWRALDLDCDDYEIAIKIATTILTGNHDYILKIFGDVWDELVMDAAGIDEEEYYSNPELLPWNSPEWTYDKVTQDWNRIDE